ncbi:MAG: hypothetical protein SFZ02_20805 [bacterium]|nr:hypothetical protein [bacterium]
MNNSPNAEIEAQLALMANDPDIQRELAQINDEFRVAEWDGLVYVDIS